MTDLLPLTDGGIHERLDRGSDPGVDIHTAQPITDAMRARVVLDTSVLIADPDCFASFDDVDIVVPLTVIEELDGLKNRADDVGRAARAALRTIEDLRVRNGGSLATAGGHRVDGTLQIEINGIQKHRLVEHGLDPAVPDNRIIGAALGQAERAPDHDGLERRRAAHQGGPPRRGRRRASPHDRRVAPSADRSAG